MFRVRTVPFAGTQFVKSGKAEKPHAFVSAALFAGLVVASGVASGDTFENLTPLYETYNSTYTDYFLTTNESESKVSIQYGYSGPSTVVAYVGRSNSSGLVKPFRRFFKSFPQLEHFYTISSADINFVTSVGYSDEGTEGFISDTSLGLLAPLYRLAMYSPGTNDLVHKYTTSVSEANSLSNYYGFNNDGIAGFVVPDTSLLTASNDPSGVLTYQTYSYSGGAQYNTAAFLPKICANSTTSSGCTAFQNPICPGVLDVQRQNGTYAAQNIVATYAPSTYLGISGCYVNLTNVVHSNFGSGYESFILKYSGAVVRRNDGSYYLLPPRRISVWLSVQ
ncbi:MAG: hypothetical protein ABL985_16195 [Casimicrobium sp.]